MSRIGKQPLAIPPKVSVSLDGSVLKVVGPKGTAVRDTRGFIKLSVENSVATVVPSESGTPAYWGLYRTLLSNMVTGVTEGYTRMLELQGTGYRAAMSGKDLALTVGFSHPVTVRPPEGIQFDVDKTGRVVVGGIDKELVGRMAATIRKIRPPEPYHGKGIRYVGEVIATKVGKSAGKK